MFSVIIGQVERPTPEVSHEWMLTISYLPGELNTMADGLSRQTRDSTGVGGKDERSVRETVSSERIQSGVGGCEGPALTKEKEETSNC